MQMKAITEGLRALMYTTAWYSDMAHHGPKKTRERFQNLLDIHIPICKSFGTDQGFEVANIGIQVLGGAGFTQNFPLEQNARDQKIGSIYEGTNGIQALDLVGRKFNSKEGQLIKYLEDELYWFDKNTPSGEIASWVTEWEIYRTIMFESIESLKNIGKIEGKDAYSLYAVNMLNLMGDVLCCFNLLKQASAAKIRWDTFLEGELSREKLLEENEEARFYWNKLCTTEFYVWSVLPRALSSAKIIKNSNLSPLKAHL